MVITRRGLIKTFASLSLLPASRVVAASIAHADERAWRHGLSLFGAVKYPADFPHFDYVNPDAPKGGRARLFTIGTFDSLNPFTYKGDSAGLVASTLDSLTKDARDEPSSQYGLIAEAMKYPDDHSSVTYRLRADARFHDGTPITTDDVIWSMNQLKLANPQSAFYYKNVERAEQTAEREVTFFFSVKGNRELPQITGQLQVLPRHYWEATDAKGRKRDLNETTLEIPLGSAAYKISKVETGKAISARLIDNYWAARLPVNVGQNNFEEIAVLYFRDETVALEAFKSDQYDYRNENSSKNWATAYDFPAVKRGDVLKEDIAQQERPGHAGLRLQHPARQVQGQAGPPRLQLCLRLRVVERQPVLWPVQALGQLFQQFRTRRHRPARAGRIEASRPLARQNPGRGVHKGLHQPGQRHPAGQAQEPAHGTQAHGRGGLETRFPNVS